MKKEQEPFQVTQLVRIGCLMFQMNCFNAIYPNLRNYIHDICAKKDWKIYLDRYWLHVLIAIQEAQPQVIDIKILSIEQIPPQPSVIYYLSFTKFTFLKKLCLDNLRITNIQSLAFIDTQNIEEINLSSNIITSFMPMSKINWPNLNFLTIKGNKVAQIKLHRTKMSKHCVSFNVDVSYDMMQVQDLSSLMKIEPNRFDSIDLSMSIYVILNQKIRDQICSKARTFVVFWGSMLRVY